MNNFLKTYRLKLTPLSPIHIGCGEDFEPTNYVIQDNILYGFDPSRAANDFNDLQRKELESAVASNTLLSIQRFFKKNHKIFQRHAHVLIPVATAVAKQYAEKLGKVTHYENDGVEVFNQLVLERTMYTGYKNQPYIPGSSLKGAMRTSLIDIRGDAFEDDSMRFLKMADFMPVGQPHRKIIFAVNRYKKIMEGKNPKGITLRKECILHGQYRAFVADAAILLPTDLRTIAKNSNTYHRTRLQRELTVLNGYDLINVEWKKKIDFLLSGKLGKKLDNGDAFLIRIGRYGGKESKVLSTVEITTKTVWLATEIEDDQKNLLPFGWAVVEIDPQEDLLELKNWCNDQPAAKEAEAAAKKQEPIIWPSAKIKFNAKNKTLSAEYKEFPSIHAIAPEGERLLQTLPPSIQSKIKRNEFVKAAVTLMDTTIIEIAYTNPK